MLYFERRMTLKLASFLDNNFGNASPRIEKCCSFEKRTIIKLIFFDFSYCLCLCECMHTPTS